MRYFFRKPYRWAIIYSLILAGLFIFVLLDTFVIPKSITIVNEAEKDSGNEGRSVSDTEISAEITERSYEDENIKITINEERKYNTDFYVAEIWLTDASLLKTALAGNTYGRNIKDTTSNIAEDNHAIFAINGDYYGFRNTGYVFRNGTLYRDTPDNDTGTEALAIDTEGNFSIIAENGALSALPDMDQLSQILSFGPALIKDGEISVDADSEVSKSRNSNPRTAIGQISELHYIVIVSDGRTEESKGLSLLELAQEFYERGCSIAYNLDGGGSSTMYFNGEVVNHPTDGRSFGEREVSDIVYIGY